MLAKRLETREWPTVESIVVFTFYSVVLLIGDEAVEDAGIFIHQRNVFARLVLKNPSYILQLAAFLLPSYGKPYTTEAQPVG